MGAERHKSGPSPLLWAIAPFVFVATALAVALLILMIPFLIIYSAIDNARERLRTERMLRKQNRLADANGIDALLEQEHGTVLIDFEANPNHAVWLVDDDIARNYDDIAPDQFRFTPKLTEPVVDGIDYLVMTLEEHNRIIGCEAGYARLALSAKPKRVVEMLVAQGQRHRALIIGTGMGLTGGSDGRQSGIVRVGEYKRLHNVNEFPSDMYQSLWKLESRSRKDVTSE